MKNAAPADGTLSFKAAIQPLLEKYCFDCHGDGTKKGGLALDIYADEAAIFKDRRTWEHVLSNVRN
ncbi:MAG: c-type cytochrome domain-containing protein, partial [Dehalococcoidia bacterium]|nr:c-type cytochrome domain-containing protein [Dehalococcoidia bacterium]